MAETDESTTESTTETSRPKHTEGADASHFGGPIGAVVLLVLMPILSIYLWICIHKHGGALVLPTLSVLGEIPLPTLRGAAYFLGFLGLQVVLQVVLPGRVVEGLAQRDGLKVLYKLNGFTSFLVTLGLLAGLYAGGVVRGADVLAELGGMLSTGILFAYAFALFLYFYGFTSPRAEQRTGLAVYDYFMGTALNPRFGKFDLKLFFESKIGLSLWIAIALAMAASEHERTGQVSASMILVLAFQIFYVADFYWFEEAMLSTWDINYENYGFMLAFAFTVWMPFNFSLQAQYLAYHPIDLPVIAMVGCGVLNFAGYYIFRTANLQKHAFRTKPGIRIWGKEPTFLQTKRGTRLLTSGWWGLARHANYLGDLMMALAWCLPAGFSHVPPYFYFIYFAPLLIDRERRDHKECKKKYGEDWDRYCEIVKYRIVPFLY